MALLTKASLHREDRSNSKVHKPVSGTFTCFIGEDGERYFQVDTFGSEDRKIPNKVSQSLQIDRETAIELIEILKREFKIK